MDTKNREIDRKELEAAQKVISCLLLARKNRSLYPEGHTISTTSIEQFFTMLRTYLQTYQDLRVDVEKDRLVSKGEVVHADTSEEGTLPFTLFRDGIRWLEFKEGVDLREATEFLEIINKYSILSAEPEGDIVTEFWERKFAHILYEAADSLGTIEHDTGMMVSSPEKRDVNVALMREKILAGHVPLPDPLIDPASLSLNPEEMKFMHEMIRLEEGGDPTAYLDALFDSLLQYRDQENFEIILKVLEEEFTGSIARRDLDAAYKILQRLQYVHEAVKSEIPWITALIEDFSLAVSSARALAPLAEIWPHIGPEQTAKAKEIISLLQPEAIHALCAMLPHNQSPQKRQVLVGAITTLASRDPRPLDALLKTPDEKLLERLIPVLAGMEGDRPVKSMIRLIRHPSVRIRQEAIKGVLQKGSHIREVFPLIDDPDESIRRMVLKQIGQSRNPVAEKLLLEYLERRTFTRDEGEHVMACFTALGQCGSAHALPYLRQTLLHRGWMPAFWRNAHRRGAAIALHRLGIRESQEVLKKAARSLYPSVRGFVREAVGQRT